MTTSFNPLNSISLLYNHWFKRVSTILVSKYYNWWTLTKNMWCQWRSSDYLIVPHKYACIWYLCICVWSVNVRSLPWPPILRSDIHFDELMETALINRKVNAMLTELGLLRRLTDQEKLKLLNCLPNQKQMQEIKSKLLKL